MFVILSRRDDRVPPKALAVAQGSRTDMIKALFANTGILLPLSGIRMTLHVVINLCVFM